MPADERCRACPFWLAAEAQAAMIAEKLCPKAPQDVPRETLISPDEAAKRLGRSRTWLDRRRLELPFVKLRPAAPGREARGYDVIESKLAAWLTGSRATLLLLSEVLQLVA